MKWKINTGIKCLIGVLFVVGRIFLPALEGVALVILGALVAALLSTVWVLLASIFYPSLK